MAYIYRKTIGDKSYYYLRISKRIKDKLVVKDIAYLGSNIEDVKNNLSKLHSYQKEIRKGYKSIKKALDSNYYLEKVRGKKLKEDGFLQKDMLEQIEAARLHYKTKFLKHDELTLKEAYKHFLIDFAFNTTSIEGNTITLNEAQHLLVENILPKDKTLREVYDLQNTESVFFWLLGNRPVIKEELAVMIHDRLLDRIDVRKGYRTHDIRVFKSRFESTPFMYIGTDMKLLFKWYEEQKKKLHPFALSVIFHHKLEKIHPFSDGNGRTGRMLMNFILIKNKYPPFVISNKRRKEYLDAMNKADLSGLTKTNLNEYGELVQFAAEEMISTYWNNFNI
jgi:Fic family protein